MYLTHNKGKTVAAERFIRTWNSKIYDFSVKKCVYLIDKLDDIVNKYNNTDHSRIKIKSIDLKWSTCIGFDIENNAKDTKCKVQDHVRISRYKAFLQKVTFQIGLKKFSWLKKVKTTMPWTYVVSDHNDEEIVATFYKKELQKPNQKQFKLKK